KGQVLGVGLGEFQVARQAQVRQLVAANPEHGVIDIRQHHQAFRAHQTGELCRQVPGAAGDVEYPVAGPDPGHLDGVLLPQAVDAAGHQVVHQVVPGGDGMEHLGHAPGFLRHRDFLEAKMGLVVAVSHGTSRAKANFTLPCQLCPAPGATRGWAGSNKKGPAPLGAGPCALPCNSGTDQDGRRRAMPSTSSVPSITWSAILILASMPAWPSITMRWAWGEPAPCMASTMVVTLVTFSIKRPILTLSMTSYSGLAT